MVFEPVRYRFAPASRGAVARLVSELGCSETFAWVLARRGLDDPVAAQEFLARARDDVDPDEFHDPLLLGDMAAAVERLRWAVERGERIAVHGDYDADGVCSTLIAVEALESLGADVIPFLPNRFEHGYGVVIETVEHLAAAGARVLLTVDCGISAAQPLAHARDLGMDVIVCDHHQPGDELPDAILVSTRPSDYPFPDLCAAGVAGKLAEALDAPTADRRHELEAIATVADVVPLIGENRAIVRRGLRALRQTERPGLRALLSACRTHAREADSETIAFRIAPHINAVGRIADPGEAFDMLRAGPDDAERYARLVSDTNDRRKRIEQDISAQAQAQIDGWTDEQRAAKAYVVAGPGWHEGVVGIVASRLVERYHRPVVVIAADEPLGRGSGRSPDTYDLHAGLAAAGDTLVRWGGHRQAAGLTIDPTMIDAFRTALCAHADEHLTDDMLVPHIDVDAVLSGDELGFELCAEIEQLAPFGAGNPKPLVLAAGATVSNSRTVGEDGAHLQATVTVDGVSARAIAFRAGEVERAVTSEPHVDVLCRPGVNRFRGREELQLQVERFVPVSAEDEPGSTCAAACDMTCTDRRDLPALLADPAAAPEPLRGSVPLRDLLSGREVIDHRGREIGTSQIARLLASGQRVLVACADVSRRRQALTSALAPQRLGAGTAVLVSGRCDILAARARLHRAARAGHGALVLADYEGLTDLGDLPDLPDAIVVMDPPVVTADAHALAAACGPATAVHLVFGAAEERFSRQVADAAADGRATLRGGWAQIREGATAGESLAAALWGPGRTHLNSPRAISHALHELRSRDIVDIGDDGVSLGTMK